MSAFLNTATWISGPTYDYGSDDAGYYENHPNHVLASSFTLGASTTTLLRVAILGFARITVNGKLATDAELLGDWTNPTKLVYFDELDVTDLVHEGTNELVIELGNGWYNPSPLTMFGKYNLRQRLAEVGTPCALAQVEADGEIVLVTDDSWRCTEGPVLFNNVYLGETYDLTYTNGSSLPVVSQANYRTLAPSVVERCRRFEPVIGSDVRTLPDGTLLVDFHELDTGMVDIVFNAQEGSEVTIRYAEEVDAQGMPSYESSHAGLVGNLVPEGFRIPGGPGAPDRTIQTDRLVAAAGENHFTNTFTVHSCRYACIEGLDRSDLVSINLVPVHTNLTHTGSVTTGNTLYDDLVDAAVRTKLNNVHGIWEDCARERLGYGGDMIALAASNLMAFDCEHLIRKTVRDFRNDQTAAGGVPETAPFVGIGSNGTAYGEGPLLWQLAYPHLTLRAYQFYGCHDLVEEEWPYVRKLVNYLLSWDPEVLSAHCLGDHGSVKTSGGFKNGTPDKELVGWCTIARFARAALRFCSILGEDGSAYEARLEHLKDQIIHRFRHNDGTWGDGTQTGVAFVADLGLDDEQAMGDMLARMIVEEDGILSTGIFGTTIAFDLLHRTGHSDVVESWLTRKEAPSYEAMLASGNKALAEQFETFLSSYNHAMFSSYLQWFYQGLGGIRISDSAVGADRVELRPHFSTKTDHVTCALQTRRGTIRTEWTREDDGQLRFAYQLPAGIQATLVVPADVTVKQL